MMSGKDRWITFREEESIVGLLDGVAKAEGSDRSTVIRRAIRKMLAELSYLPEEAKKALAVSS